MISLDQDTFSGVEHLESMIERAGLREEKKMEQAKQVVEQEIDLPFLSQKMGFPLWGTHPTGRVQEIPNPDSRGKEDFPQEGFWRII